MAKKTPQEIGKDTKFEHDLLKTNETTSPQSHLILYTLVWWWWWWWWGEGGGRQVRAPTIQASVKFRDFVEKYRR